MAIAVARPSKEDLSGRSYSLVVVLLLAIHAVLAWIARQPGILTTQDDAIYVLLGRALHAISVSRTVSDRPPGAHDVSAGLPVDAVLVVRNRR